MSGPGEITHVLSGETLLFEDYENSGPMWSQDGDRRARVPVKFDIPFAEPPIVHLSITMMDARTDMMIRYRLRAENIEPEGFNIVFSTWSDSKFARISVSWLALGTRIAGEYWVDF